jgi:hypothetical protein
VGIFAIRGFEDKNRNSGLRVNCGDRWRQGESLMNVCLSRRSEDAAVERRTYLCSSGRVDNVSGTERIARRSGI